MTVRFAYTSLSLLLAALAISCGPVSDQPGDSAVVDTGNAIAAQSDELRARPPGQGYSQVRPCNCGTGVQSRQFYPGNGWTRWSRCEGGPAFPVTPGTTNLVCPPYNNPAVFMAAHADDETIGMAGAIREHVLAGRDVFLELMTHGDKSAVFERLDDGLSHPWHPGVHEHPMTRQEFGNARTREFVDAATRLGVTGIRVNDFGDGGGSLTVAEVTTRIDFWIAEGGSGLSMKSTAGANDPTTAFGVPASDHAAIWNALVASGYPDIRAYLIYHYTLGYGTGFSTVPLSPALCAAKSDAIDAYRVWDPANGRYAIGNHSVASLLNAAESACEEYIVFP